MFAAALPGILDVDLPDLLAGSLIERDQVIVGGPEKDAAAAYGQTAVLLSIKRDGFRKGKTILPDEPAGGAIERKHPAIGSGEIEYAAGNDRRGL